MQHDFNILAELRAQKVEPFKAVGAFKHIVAEELAAAFAGGGVVTGEDIKAPAVVQVIEHTCGLGMLGVVAVYDKH